MASRCLLAALTAVCAVGTSFAVGELDGARLHGATDKARAIDYAPGEEMVFTLTLEGVERLPAEPYFIRWKRTGDDGCKEEGKVPLSLGKPLVLRTSLAKPGFVRILAEVVDGKGIVYRKVFRGDKATPEGRAALNRFESTDKRVFFDGSAGVHPEKLQSVPEPADFDAFWAKRRATLAAVPMNPVVREHSPSGAAIRVRSFSVGCAGLRPVTGTYTVPANPGRYPARIRFHGYGAAFIQQIPQTGPDGIIDMFINAHGYELGREKSYYDSFYESIKSNGRTFGFDREQNRDPETAYFGGMTWRIMRALEFLKTLPEWDGRNLEATGGSMGGLQTVWAAALDPAVTVATPAIPWCCDIGGRETLGRIVDPWHINETAALRYYDPVNLARRVNPACRFEITRAGLGDYCCPPSGVAILYNNLPCAKRINWVQGSTHGYVPPKPNQAFMLEEEARLPPLPSLSRREELVRTLCACEYGFRPVERPDDLRFAQVGTDESAFGGTAVSRRIRATYSGPYGRSEMNFRIWIPKNRGKAPVFIHCSPRPAETAADSGDPRPWYRTPAEKIVRRGYAAIAYCNQEVAVDWNLGPAVPTSGVFAAFGPLDLDRRGRTEWGILSAWAWGMSRILDWIGEQPDLDASRVAAVGLSRNGKTALIAGLMDTRFAMVVSCCSGTGGAKLNHMDLPKSESIRQISIARRWFAPAYFDWIDRDRETPFDQHQLLAAIAPRLLYVSSATEDDWAGPRGEFAAAERASEAWESHGRKGLVSPDGFPPPDSPRQEGDIGYHLRTGPHSLKDYDWDRYLDFADRHGWNR